MKLFITSAVDRAKAITIGRDRIRNYRIKGAVKL